MILARPRLLDHGGADRGAVEQRRAGRDLGAFADHQHLGELDRGAGLCRELLDRDDIVLGDLVLLAAGPDHCEHNTRRYGLPRTRAQPPSARTCRRTGPTRPRAAHYRSAARAVNRSRRGFDGSQDALSRLMRDQRRPAPGHR